MTHFTKTKSSRADLGLFRCISCVLLVSFGAVGCGPHARSEVRSQPVVLTLMGNGDSTLDQKFTNSELRVFKQRTGVQVRNLVDYATIDQRLELFQQLFERRSAEPDLLKIDTIWPGLLADDLIDLRPYVGDEITAISPNLLSYFTVKGRLVALPMLTDSGVLYYRTDLLRKYGYHQPPKTWDELGEMATVIQRGERKSGKRDFWGFIWQGILAEALTCNAMEWQVAEGGGRILGDDGTVDASNEGARRALERAVSWVGTISPPSVVEYDEDDSEYLWQSGNAAFMRGWVDGYQSSQQPRLPVAGKIGMALLPGGAGGRGWAFGGMALAVSKYSRHRKEAVEAIRFLVSPEVQRERARTLGQVPSRTALLSDESLMPGTILHTGLAKQWEAGMFVRPSTIAGKYYQHVSRAYAVAVHRALERKVSPAKALADLQSELLRVTGFRAKQNGAADTLAAKEPRVAQVVQ